MDLYFPPFFLSFVASVFGIGAILFLQKRFSFFQTNRSEKGREERKHVSRFGGIVAGGVFLGVLFFDASLKMTGDIWGLVVGCFGMFVLGFWDDVRAMQWKKQLLFQGGIVMVTVLVFGVRMHSIPDFFGGRIFFEGGWEYVGAVLAIGWFLLIINALNWSDGIDGVAPGIVVLAALAFFAVSMRPEVAQPPVAILSLALLGSYLGLFVCNMHPAKIFSGTTGVFVAGFALAYVSLFAGAKVATALLVLGIPIADLIRVVVLRYRSGVSIAFPDKTHLHYQCLRSGWSERGTGFFLLGIVAFGAFSTFFFGTFGKVAALVFLFFVFFLLTKKLRSCGVFSIKEQTIHEDIFISAKERAEHNDR